MLHCTMPSPIIGALVLLQRNARPDCRAGATVARQQHTIEPGGGKIQGPAKIRQSTFYCCSEN
jgi:hypothetical protein